MRTAGGAGAGEAVVDDGTKQGDERHRGDDGHGRPLVGRLSEVAVSPLLSNHDQTDHGSGGQSIGRWIAGPR